MIKVFFIAIIVLFFCCKHPESKEYESFKEVTIVKEKEKNTESNIESNSYKVIAIN